GRHGDAVVDRHVHVVLADLQHAAEPAVGNEQTRRVRVLLHHAGREQHRRRRHGPPSRSVGCTMHENLPLAPPAPPPPSDGRRRSCTAYPHARAAPANLDPTCDSTNTCTQHNPDWISVTSTHNSACYVPDWYIHCTDGRPLPPRRTTLRHRPV